MKLRLMDDESEAAINAMTEREKLRRQLMVKESEAKIAAIGEEKDQKIRMMGEESEAKEKWIKQEGKVRVKAVEEIMATEKMMMGNESGLKGFGSPRLEKAEVDALET